MKYARIKYCDVANGIGVRTSLFVSGCTHRCEGCFNEEAWDFNFGMEFDETVEESILESVAPDYISGLSLLGGEPMETVNQAALINLLRKFKDRYPDKSIWCYTGYTYKDDFVPGARAYADVTDEFLSLVDVLVDGEFVLSKLDIRLKFRGSSNQRLIDLKKMREINTEEIKLWEG